MVSGQMFVPRIVHHMRPRIKQGFEIRDLKSGVRLTYFPATLQSATIAAGAAAKTHERKAKSPVGIIIRRGA